MIKTHLSLVLVDGFLQLNTPLGIVHHKVKSQSLF